MWIQTVRSIRKIRKMQEWPRTSGQITESGVSGEWSGRGGRYLWTEKPRVTYRYVVDGREHVGHQMGPTEINTGSKRAAEKKIEPFPVGKEVDVHYDPENPADAVLRKEADPIAIIAVILIGLLPVILGTLLVLGIISL
jgi:hypothetical protein